MLNSLAAIAVASELGIDDARDRRALAGFQGIDRRLQHVADVETPAAARSRSSTTTATTRPRSPRRSRRMRQGYRAAAASCSRSSRIATRARAICIDDFGKSLSGADVLLVTEVYAAGEAPIAGADGRAICRAVRRRGKVEPVFVEKVEELATRCSDVLQAGDVIVTMGAGHISAVSHGLPAKLAASAPTPITERRRSQ